MNRRQVTTNPMKRRGRGGLFAQQCNSACAAALFTTLLLISMPSLADESQWSEELCEEFKQVLVGQSGPVPILSFDPASYENLYFDELVTRGGYRVALVGAKDGEIEIDSKVGPNQRADDAYVDAIATHGAAGPPVTNSWETFVFLAKRRQDVEEIDCSREVDAEQRRTLITYAYGPAIWPPRRALRWLDLVLDEEREFLYFVAEITSESYYGMLVQRRGPSLHSILMFHSSEDVVRDSLGRTALLNLE